MKNILCFGDSNTWGVIPQSRESLLPPLRYDEKTRWPCILNACLGADWKIIEEGLGGRTSVYSVPGEEYRLSSVYLKPCLLSHMPLDYIIMMIGLNDIQPKFHNQPLQPDKLTSGIRNLIDIINATPEAGVNCIPPKVLLISPPPIRLADSRPDINHKYGYEAGVNLSGHFAEAFKQLAAELNIEFLDSSEYAETSKIDGIHLTEESHIRLGQAAAAKILHIESVCR